MLSMRWVILVTSQVNIIAYSHGTSHLHPSIQSFMGFTLFYAQNFCMWKETGVKPIYRIVPDDNIPVWELKSQ